MLSLVTQFGDYHLHSEGTTLSIGFGAGEAVPRAASSHPPREHMVPNENRSAWIFPHRYDSALNSDAQVKTYGNVYGRSLDRVPPHSNYFRETYSFGGPGGLTHYHLSAAAVCERFEKAAGSAARSLYIYSLVGPWSTFPCCTATCCSLAWRSCCTQTFPSFAASPARCARRGCWS